MPIELKICGINSKNIIQTIIQNGGCQYLGFIFYPLSPRNLSIDESKKLTSIVPNHIKKVAVLVNPENSFIKKIFYKKRFFLKKLRPKLDPSTGILCSQSLKSLVLIFIPYFDKYSFASKR